MCVSVCPELGKSDRTEEMMQQGAETTRTVLYLFYVQVIELVGRASVAEVAIW